MKPQHIETRNRCRRCGRPLKKPESIAAGMGPKCRGITPMFTPVDHERPANYVIVIESLFEVVLRDLGPWDRFKTITNAAEDVIDELRERGALAHGQRVFYYDSEGAYGEITVKDQRFAGFAPAVQEVKPL